MQEGDPILREVARPFDLPAKAEDARRVVAQLSSAMSRVASAHTFGKGMGIAAPQVGIGRAAALVRTPDAEETPGDEQYEGCLSFFDVRGVVNRPVTLHVEHQDLDGNTRITIFDRGTARLVAHEIDHLNGMLGANGPGRRAHPVSEYRQGGERGAIDVRLGDFAFSSKRGSCSSTVIAGTQSALTSANLEHRGDSLSPAGRQA